MISVHNLSFHYTAGNAIRFPDFTVAKGEHCLLLGESGSGKTTLLHLLGGLLRHYTGSVQVDHTELSQLSETSLDRFRGQHIGFIFQRNHLIPALTVEKNLMMAPYLAGIRINEERITEVLSGLGLTEKRKSSVTQLSHGQAQRVAIARAVLNKPSIIFADEPTSALDDKNCDRVIHLLMDVASQNQSTLLVATHDQRLKEKISKQIRLTSGN
ncbi:ABC transporter ATP-binding protein [Ohtaekwangia sp.]|uniref:ABC transporter ATP-binding protein n=1 Tax=Ohtaekwangia sp. TaxID=2066019 RepID=UPI002FDCF33D